MRPHTHKSPPPRAETVEDVITQLESLRHELVQQAENCQERILELPSQRRHSALNMLYYLALRSRNLQPLQDQLTRLGLSSLGRLEPHVMATIDAVLHNLHLLSGRKPPGASPPADNVTFDGSADQLEQNTIGLLGARPAKRRVHIMVSLPAQAENDYTLVHQLFANGMDCIRINCALDDPSVWAAMIRQVRHAERVSGQSCRILMDLRGPKLRTGPMEQMAAVLKIRPVRSRDGCVVRPARIWLASPGAAQAEMSAADAMLILDRAWLARIAVGDRIYFRDARASRRCWRIREVTADGCWAEARKTAYVTNGTVLHVNGDKDHGGRTTAITGLSSQESSILLRAGDLLLLSGSEAPGKPAIHDSNGELLSPGRVSLPIAEIYRDVRPGEPICFDDGRIAGMVEHCDGQQLRVLITHTRKPVEKLGGNKGVNLPDTDLRLPALSSADQDDLDFVARHADLIGLSFTNSADDVRALRDRLLTLGRCDTGVVVKIETKRGFNNLPSILLEALKFPACGVMIARGDLAAECGLERMAELQEEILWVCESAHVPTIWATQVLENLIKRGHASRAEITDAAMGQAAECIMLSKGPYIKEAVRTLDDILRRMQGHHHKKRSMLRKLHLAEGFCSTG